MGKGGARRHVKEGSNCELTQYFSLIVEKLKNKLPTKLHIRRKHKHVRVREAKNHRNPSRRYQNKAIKFYFCFKVLLSAKILHTNCNLENPLNSGPMNGPITTLFYMYFGKGLTKINFVISYEMTRLGFPPRPYWDFGSVKSIKPRLSYEKSTQASLIHANGLQECWRNPFYLNLNLKR